MSRASREARRAQQQVGAVEPDITVEVEEGEGELLEAFMIRVEKRRGTDHPEWRCITVQLKPDGSTSETTSAWRPRAQFYADLALTKAPFNRFAFDGVGRPVM